MLNKKFFVFLFLSMVSNILSAESIADKEKKLSEIKVEKNKIESRLNNLLDKLNETSKTYSLLQYQSVSQNVDQKLNKNKKDFEKLYSQIKQEDANMDNIVNSIDLIERDIRSDLNSNLEKKKQEEEKKRQEEEKKREEQEKINKEYREKMLKQQEEIDKQRLEIQRQEIERKKIELEKKMAEKEAKIKRKEKTGEIITYKEFCCIKVGMTRGDVLDIIGVDGVKGSSTRIIDSVMTTYTWENSNFSSVIIVFDDNIVYSIMPVGSLPK